MTTTIRITTLLVLTLVACSNAAGDDEGSGPITTIAGEDSSSSSAEDDDTSTDEASTSGPSSSSEDGSSSGDESSSSTGEPACEGAVLEHEACGPGCAGTCDDTTECRYNYAGGYLAECETACELDVDCPTVGDVCSAGYCITACLSDADCGADRWCYPGPGITDTSHPIAHCMTKAVGA